MKYKRYSSYREAREKREEGISLQEFKQHFALPFIAGMIRSRAEFSPYPWMVDYERDDSNSR